MYNLRYHLASLVSVFLALAIGLMLGGLIADQAPTAAQDVLVKGIEKDIAQTREVNGQLRGENKNLGDFSDELLQSFAEGRLEEDTVLVLSRNNRDANAAVVALENAGARVIVQLPTYDIEAEAWLIDETAFFNPKKPKEQIVSVLINIFEPEADDEHGDLPAYLDYLQALAQQYELLVVCASTDAEDSLLVEQAWEQGFSGTNQLRNRFGSYTLVALLSGGRPGLYGTDAAATGLYPFLPIDEPAPMPIVAPEPEEEELDKGTGQLSQHMKETLFKRGVKSYFLTAALCILILLVAGALFLTGCNSNVASTGEDTDASGTVDKRWDDHQAIKPQEGERVYFAGEEILIDEKVKVSFVGVSNTPPEGTYPEGPLAAFWYTFRIENATSEAIVFPTLLERPRAEGSTGTFLPITTSVQIGEEVNNSPSAPSRDSFILEPGTSMKVTFEQEAGNTFGPILLEYSPFEGGKKYIFEATL